MARRRRFGRRARRAASRVGGYARRGYRRARRRFARRSGHKLGLLGKGGAVVMATPVIVSAVDAGAQALGVMSMNVTNILGAGEIALVKFCNDLSYGFGLGQAITSFAVPSNTPGVNLVVDQWIQPHSGLNGAWWKLETVGVSALAIDLIVGWASRKLARRKHGVKVAGMQMTGG